MMTRRRTRLVWVGLLGAALWACSDPVSTSSSDEVTASASLFEVVITNERADSISYFVIDDELASRSLLSLGIWPGAPWIQPGENARVRGPDIGGWREGEAVLIYWWHAVPSGDGGFEMDSIRALRVEY